MSVMQSNLPYTPDALEPHLSETSVSLAYQRYHRLVVDTLNARIADSTYADKSLEQVMDRAVEKDHDVILDEACEAWNYSFSWQSMRPFGGGRPGGLLAALIDRKFGSFDEFRSEFAAAAREHAGTGWLWLAQTHNGLEIVHTDGGESLATTGRTPLLVLNLARHAYVHDYRGDPSEYAVKFLELTANWDFAEAMLDESQNPEAA